MSSKDDVLEIDNLLDELTTFESFDNVEDFATLEAIDSEQDVDKEKFLYLPKSKLSAGQVINIIRRMLREVNSSYIDLAERTAFCAIKIYDYALLKNKNHFNIDRNALIIFSVFFTIGYYNKEITNDKTIDSTTKTRKTFLYSCLYLKHMTPIKNIAESILFYSTNWQKENKLGCNYTDYSSLIFTCMRICIVLRKNHYVYKKELFDEDFIKNCNKLYNPIFLSLFLEEDLCTSITKKLENNNFYYLLDDYCNSIQIDYSEEFNLLKMLLYVMDFVSTSTVTHIISTAFFATEIATIENLTEDEVDEVFTAAILHDVGKMSIDVSILESPGRLTEEQMQIMKSHVRKGDDIYRGIIGSKLADIASRHHEKPDGTGYPYGLKEDELSVQQRILSIADVYSALTDARTYKPAFSIEKAIEIMTEMAKNKKLDSVIFDHTKNRSKEILQNVNKRRPMLIANIGKLMLDFMQYGDYDSIEKIYKEMHGVR